MKKFVALYLAPASAIEQMKEQMKKAGPEQAKAGMELWMKWSKQHEKSIVELGAPLGRTKRITAGGASDARNDVTGYSIVQAETHEAAAKMFEGHPHFRLPGGSVEVLEVMPIPGM
jgi:YCII-related domain